MCVCGGGVRRRGGGGRREGEGWRGEKRGGGGERGEGWRDEIRKLEKGSEVSGKEDTHFHVGRERGKYWSSTSPRGMHRPQWNRTVSCTKVHFSLLVSVYSDTDMIKRNASVIVMRSVIQNAAKLPKTQ